MIERQNDRHHVAWDLETTGFAWSDQITVSGFWFPDGHTELVINTDGEELNTDQAEVHLEDASGGVPVSVTTTDDEDELMKIMQQIVFGQFDRHYNRLVAYNAESWKNGFDLPFLRTRCLKHDKDWIFSDLQFADLWNPVKKRFNTTHAAHGKSLSVNSLTGAHDLLFSQPHQTLLESEQEPEMDHPWYCETQYDPFEDSSSAVRCYKQGEFLPLLQHNLADIHRTWELGELTRMYVSSNDITTKKL